MVDSIFVATRKINKNWRRKIRCIVKVRYRHPGQYATIEMTENNLALITFDEPVRAAAPIQSAVFYNSEGCVIGGGIIARVL